MADANDDPKAHSEGEGGEMEARVNSLPANLMHLYMQLAEKGWRQSPATSNDADKKTSERKRRPAPTIEVNHLVLEKPYPQIEADPEQDDSNTTRIKMAKVVLRLVDGKIACRMYTEPEVRQFQKTSVKNAVDGDLFVEEIEDYWEHMDLSYRVKKVQQDTRLAFKTTTQFLDIGGRLVSVDERQ